jgi:hypothetical protein
MRRGYVAHLDFRNRIRQLASVQQAQTAAELPHQSQDTSA